MPDLKAMHAKGLCIDDTTFSTCADRVPVNWPNTQERVQTIRMFKAWDEKWTGDREAANEAIAKWARAAGGKVLLGTEVTCDKEKNDRHWKWSKALLEALGPDHVFGISVGNEMDLYLLKNKTEFNITVDCINEQWGWNQTDNGMNSSYLYRLFDRWTREMDALPGFAEKQIPVTTVLSGVSLANPDPTKPFMDGSPGWFDMDLFGHAMVNTLLENVTKTFGRRFAASLNIYPYFDENGNHLDFNSTDRCQDTVYTDLCFNNGRDRWGNMRCKFIGTAMNFRKKLTQLTNRTDDTFWVAEFGWSYPAATTLKKPMSYCEDFISPKAFVTAYQGFMQWDVTMPEVEPPSHVFYFTVRNSVNFGETESFGLVDTCESEHCKLQCTEEDGCPVPYCWASGSPTPCKFHDMSDPVSQPTRQAPPARLSVTVSPHFAAASAALLFGVIAAAVALRHRHRQPEDEDLYMKI